MWKSQITAIDAVPPRSMTEFLTLFPNETFALKCYAPSCKKCSQFNVEESAHFESVNGIKQIIAWDCSDTNKRSFAIDLGVTSIPAYIVLNGGKINVLTIN